MNIYGYMFLIGTIAMIFGATSIKIALLLSGAWLIIVAVWMSICQKEINYRNKG